MITDKQFAEFVWYVRRLLFDGNDVYLHGKKVVRIDTGLNSYENHINLLITSPVFHVNKDLKIWTKNPGETSYVSYTKASINNGTKLHRLYDAVQTIRNDYTYMQAKLALKKYEEKYGSENRGDGNTVGNDQVPAGTS
jgi:hypothetical protein